MDKRETRWSIWLPISFSAIGAIVFLILLIASKADAGDVMRNTSRIDRMEVHLRYLIQTVYTMALAQGVPVPPPPPPGL